MRRGCGLYGTPVQYSLTQQVRPGPAALGRDGDGYAIVAGVQAEVQFAIDRQQLPGEGNLSPDRLLDGVPG